MAQLKTKATDADVLQFINIFADTDQKKKDSYALLDFMEKVTGHPAKMWGPTIIGFGLYHYVSDKGHQKDDLPLAGFSPRKAAFSLYVYTGDKQHEHLLEGLGKFKMGKACIYVKKLSDINMEQLKTLMLATIEHIGTKYGNA